MRQLAERVASMAGHALREEPDRSAAYTQNNRPAQGSTLYAAQGTQNIHLPPANSAN
jgi:hypothetical protein